MGNLGEGARSSQLRHVAFPRNGNALLRRHVARAGMRGLAWRMLALTAVLGIAFLAVEGYEYQQDLASHYWPGTDFAVHEMTGVHGVHVVVAVPIIVCSLGK